MNRSRAVAALAAMVALCSAAAALAVQQPTFRAGTNVVLVDVLVRDEAGMPVTMLGASNFQLFDGGFPQAIDHVWTHQMPVELSLVLDTSGSTSSVVSQFAANARRVASMLRPGDHVRVVAFATAVVDIVPLQPGARPIAMDDAMPAGGTSLNEALLLSLVRQPAVGRRHLIVAFTDGIDTSSVVDTVAVNQAARRSEGVLHIVLANPNAGSAGDLAVRSRLLREAAEATGGGLHASPALGDAVAALERVFDEFRHSYVLHYSPKNVRGTGWREIAVRVAGPDAERYTVRARKGYFAR